MVQERIERPIPGEGQPEQPHTTIIVEERRSHGKTIFVALFMVLAIAVAAFVFSEMKGAEMAKDDAVARAADSVEKAANQIGAAADKAGVAAQEAVDRVDNQ